MNYVEAHIDALLQRLQDVSTGQCLLWIDPAQQDVFCGHALVEERRIRVPIKHANFDPALAPYLVPLNITKYDDAELFGQSVRLAWQAWQIPSLLAGNGQPVCGWVVCAAPAAELAAHWGQRCSLHRVGTQRMRLRFHDPSVREWLWPTLNSTQRQQLLGPAQALWSIGRQDQILKHAHVSNTPRQNEDGAALVLTDTQWSQVNDYATLHGAWLDYCQLSESHRRILSREQPNWLADALNALQQASHFGIADPQDRRLFAFHALQLGAAFYQHPKLQAVWQRTRQGEFYGGALEDAMQQSSDQLAGFLEKESSDASN